MDSPSAPRAKRQPAPHFATSTRRSRSCATRSGSTGTRWRRAETAKPTLLFETGLPTRYYLPKTHVRLDLLGPSDTASHCPYKGQAEYWSIRLDDEIRPDIAWSYRTPLPESQKIAGLISFYPDKVELHVDGIRQA
jgi:uncharacterized protein (DUF427 family)